MAHRVVAVVNHEAITPADLQEAIAMDRYQNRREGPVSDEFVRQFLSKMIDHRLQLQEADREKIVVRDALRVRRCWADRRGWAPCR